MSSQNAPAISPERSRLILASGFQPDYVREVANAYARNGFSVQVIGGDMHRGEDYAPGVRLMNIRGRDQREKNLPAELCKLARYYLRLLRVVISAPSGVLYDVSIGRPFLRCLLMYTAFRLLGVRIIYTAHNVLPHDRKTLLNRGIYFLIYRVLASAIVVHGKSLKRDLVRLFRVPEGKVHVVHHGTYHPPSDPALTKSAARRGLGLSEEARVLLVFGFQRPYKGTHCVLKALAAQPLPGVLVLLRGLATDQAYQAELEHLAEGLPQNCRADMLFGSVPPEQVEGLFKASDIVLLPYLDGSQSGIKYMAYAYGRPVLASDMGGVGEFIQPGVTGEIFPARDFSAFRETLARMLERLPQYSEEEIRRIAYSEYSFESAARAVEAIHQSLAAAAPALDAAKKESA